MHGDGVADAVGAVSDELGGSRGARAVDGHGVPALRRVGRVRGRREPEDIGPLLHRLGVCDFSTPISMCVRLGGAERIQGSR